MEDVGAAVVVVTGVGVAEEDSIEIRQTTRVHLVTVDSPVVTKSLMLVNLPRDVVAVMVVLVEGSAVVAMFLSAMEMPRMENILVDLMNAAVGPGVGKLFCYYIVNPSRVLLSFFKFHFRGRLL